VQAARSGRQNIAEGSQTSGTSKKGELKLVGVARASQTELLEDYEDFLRQRGLALWSKDDPRARAVRALAYRTNRSYRTYETYMGSPEGAANCAICLIHQTNYLLDKQLAALEKDFLENGGFTERLYRMRLAHRSLGEVGVKRADIRQTKNPAERGLGDSDTVTETRIVNHNQYSRLSITVNRRLSTKAVEARCEARGY